MSWIADRGRRSLERMLTPLLDGIGLGLSLIVAIGAQNLLVLRQGIRRQHVLAVAAICALSDLALIVVGVSGVGAVMQAVPWLVDVIRWAGAAFLVAYGLLAARRAIRPSGVALDASGGADAPGRSDAGAGTPAASDDPGASGGLAAPGGLAASGTATATVTRTATARSGLLATVLTCLALTWLNPHVYLDTVVLLGAVAQDHGDPGRWVFGLGAVAASATWFAALGFGARRLRPLFARPGAWRVLDASVALVMATLAVLLLA